MAVERRLEAWNQNLPSELRSQESVNARANIHLQVMYNMIWVELGRPSLLSTVKQALNTAANRRYTGSSVANPEQRSRLAALCVSSAQTVLELIQSLRHLDMLASFSYTDFHACSSAAVLMLLDSALHHQSDYAVSLIKFGIETMEFLASGNNYACKGVRLVKRFCNMLGKVTSGNTLLPQPSASPVRRSRRIDRAMEAPASENVQYSSQTTGFQETSVQTDTSEFQYGNLDFSDGAFSVTPGSWIMDRDYEVADFVALESIMKMHPDIWDDSQLSPDLSFEGF